MGPVSTSGMALVLGPVPAHEMALILTLGPHGVQVRDDGRPHDVGRRPGVHPHHRVFPGVFRAPVHLFRNHTFSTIVPSRRIFLLRIAFSRNFAL